MNYIMIGSFLIGSIILLTSFDNFKNIFKSKKDKAKKYKANSPKINLAKSKFYSKLIEKDKKTNMKKFTFISEFNKAKDDYRLIEENNKEYGSKVISSYTDEEKNIYLNKLTNKYYVSMLATPIILMIVLFSSSIVMKKVAYKAAIDPYTIESNNNNIIRESDAKIIMDKYGKDYQSIIDEKGIQVFANMVKNFSDSQKLNLEDEVIITFVNYLSESSYIKKIDSSSLLMIFLVSVVSLILFPLGLSIRYKFIKNKLLQEFNNLELIALLQLKRKITVYQILNELNLYSQYLRPYLTRCLNKYNSSPQQALTVLSEELADDNFKKFIEILKSSLNNSTGINQDLLYYQRKLRFEEEFNKKDNDTISDEFLLTAAQLPIMAVCVLMFMIPLLKYAGNLINNI